SVALRPPSSTLFPYTTLFRSNAGSVNQKGLELSLHSTLWETDHQRFLRAIQLGSNLTFSKFNFGDYVNDGNDYSGNKLTGVPSRSEEHTSELQSRENIVCRLL